MDVFKIIRETYNRIRSILIVSSLFPVGKQNNVLEFWNAPDISVFLHANGKK